jgi:hypothetical protein
MKVFISWSGETSKAVATALHEWLPKVIQSVQPWISNHNIPSGSRWHFQLSEQLQDLKTGILCLTPDNLTAPWILFEAGALSKTLDDSLVCPYLFRLEPSDVEWPLAQFQLEKADKEGTKKLLVTINNTAGESKLDASRLDEAFEMWWPSLDEQLKKLPVSETPAPKRRDPESMIEEILDTVRKLDRNFPTPTGHRAFGFGTGMSPGIVGETIKAKAVTLEDLQPDLDDKKLSEVYETNLRAALAERLNALAEAAVAAKGKVKK